MPWIDAFLPVEAINKEIMARNTFGHLMPKNRKVYRGYMVFTLGEYGDYTPIKASFDGLDDSPWFFGDMMRFIEEKAIERGCVYRFDGTYTRFKDGDCRFKGSVGSVAF